MKEVKDYNNVIETLSNMSKPLSLVKSYNDYVKKFKEDNSDVYNYYQQKFLQNDKIVEEIIKDLDKVSITDKNGFLQLSFVKNNKEIFFYIENLTDNDLIIVLNKQEEILKEEDENLKIINDRINQLETEKLNLKPNKPKRFLGIFVDFEDKERCQKVYRKKLRKIDSQMFDELDSKRDLENNIKSSKSKISDLKSTIEFICSLTTDEKKVIVDKYNQVEKIFEIDQNDILNFNKFNSQIIPLADYVSEKFKVDSKKELFPLIKYLYGVYRNIRSDSEYVEMSDLSTLIDFKQYKEEVDALTFAMYDQQFGKITPSRIKSYENDTFIKLKKKNGSNSMDNENTKN